MRSTLQHTFIHQCSQSVAARSGYGWECSSPDGFALNSKWNEAEKYICNPTLRGGSNGVSVCKNTQWAILSELHKQNYNVCASYLPFPAATTPNKSFCSCSYNTGKLCPISYSREENGGHDQRCGNPKHTT
ncbi:hypothetical protein CK203_023592 [Vitis vinifera]|uniref:Uncharacterized protein n=1 Tax=Vitis vinifera TaxID=29760 RepID=A0A438JBQ4_VITVI|nr:hypothetical protein CK203_023592 [Vitis vinifera]